MHVEAENTQYISGKLYDWNSAPVQLLDCRTLWYQATYLISKKSQMIRFKPSGTVLAAVNNINKYRWIWFYLNLMEDFKICLTLSFLSSHKAIQEMRYIFSLINWSCILHEKRLFIWHWKHGIAENAEHFVSTACSSYISDDSFARSTAQALWTENLGEQVIWDAYKYIGNCDEKQRRRIDKQNCDDTVSAFEHSSTCWTPIVIVYCKTLKCWDCLKPPIYTVFRL